MSLLDFWRLIRKNLALVLVAALIGAAIGFAYAELTKEGASASATALVVSNSQANGVKSLVDAEIRTMQADPEHDLNNGYSADFSIVTNQTTLEITVSGPEGERCIELANTIATNAAEAANQFFVGYENPYTGYAIPATSADEQGGTKGALKYVLAGFIAGLFLGLCVLLLRDLKKRSVKSLEGMQDAVQLSVLEKLPAANGERLLANVRFAAKSDDIADVCVVPLSDASPAAEVCALIEAASAAEGTAHTVTAQATKPFSATMEGAYQARDASAALVVAKQWDDSTTALETTVAELQLAGANLVGLVYAE